MSLGYRLNRRLVYLFAFLLQGAAVDVLADSNTGIEQRYMSHCSGCHGQAMTGGQAGSLVDKVWQYGNSDADIARNITQGIHKVGMPAFQKVFDQDTIRTLVIYLREQEYRHAQLSKAPSPPKASFVSEAYGFGLEELFSGTGRLWGIDLLPNGAILVTQQDGVLWYYEAGKKPYQVKGVPKVRYFSQGGLLDVMSHPNYAKNGWLYLSFSRPEKVGKSMTEVVRGRIKKGMWTDQETVFSVEDRLLVAAGHHYGSRFAFQDNYLFFSIGDRGEQTSAQDLSLPSGKIHRLHDDGRIPKDNPFVDHSRALPSIWSYGHRNPQGLTVDPGTGQLWQTEHGPRGGDELNRIEKGRNYGWPLRSLGMNYDGTLIPWRGDDNALTASVYHWTPSIAVSNLVFYAGNVFPQWQNQLIVASLAKQELHRLEMKADTVVRDEIIMQGQGRIRDIAVGRDGFVYIILNPNGKTGAGTLYRLVPKP